MERKLLYLYPSAYYRENKLINHHNFIKFTIDGLNEKNIKLMFFSFNCSDEEITKSKLKVKEYKFLKEIEFFYIKGIKSFGLFKLLYNLINVLIISIKQKPDAYLCYGVDLAYLALIFKKIFRYKVIIDVRGDKINEMTVRKKSKFEIFIFKVLFKKVLPNADLIMPVSDEMQFPIKANVLPKYNFYDKSFFNFDLESAKVFRRELGLENRFVIVYSGTYRYYQMNEESIRFFSQFLKIFPDAFFQINTTSEKYLFKSVFDSYNISEKNYAIYNLDYKEVFQYQSFADIGFLMRENLPLNHYSFPTKFSEYLASGVPVLTTPYIFSIRKMIEKTDLGEIIEIKENYIKDIKMIYKKYFNNWKLKQECANFANDNLSWQGNGKKFAKIISEMIND